MIGRNTLIVKDKGRYRAHVFGGPGGDFTAQELAEFDRSNQKNAVSISETEALQAGDAKQNVSEFKPFYSRFAGDWFYSLNLDD